MACGLGTAQWAPPSLRDKNGRGLKGPFLGLSTSYYSESYKKLFDDHL